MRTTALVLGILGGVFWISLGFYPPACAPVSETTEIFCNRLWTPALFAMLMGMIGLYRLIRPALSKIATPAFIGLDAGFGLMVAGNFCEYWIFYNWPHTGPDGYLRGLLWMTTLLGWLLVLMGTTATGLAILYTTRTVTLLTIVFLVTLPLTIAIGFFQIRGIGIPLGILAICSSATGLSSSKNHFEPTAKPA